MIFQQYRYETLDQASHFLGFPRQGVAFVADPIQDLGTGFDSRDAQVFSLSILGVLETHVQAHYRSCARQLAEESKCPPTPLP